MRPQLSRLFFCFLTLVFSGLHPFAVAATDKEIRPVYETINQYPSIKQSTLLWGSINEVFVRVKLSSVSVYPGEPITLTYDLLSRLNADSKGMETIEKTAGFGKVEIPGSYLQFPVRRSLFFKDKQYRQDTIRKVVLFARSSGEKKVIPGSVRAVYFSKKQEKPGSLLLEGGEVLKVAVKNFPAGGQPDNFSGIAGDFHIRSWMDLKDYESEGSVKMVVEVSGTGDLSLLKLPEVTWPEGLNLRGQTDEMTISFNEKGCELHKSFIFNLVPQKSGNFTAPSFQISFFSPVVKKYKTLVSQPVTFEINELSTSSSPVEMEKSQGNKVSEESSAGVTQEEPAKVESVPAIAVTQAAAAPVEEPAAPQAEVAAPAPSTPSVPEAGNQAPAVAPENSGASQSAVTPPQASASEAIGTTAPAVPAQENPAQ